MEALKNQDVTWENLLKKLFADKCFFVWDQFRFCFLIIFTKQSTSSYHKNNDKKHCPQISRKKIPVSEVHFFNKPKHE
jgi:hypothetical protein